MVFLLLNIVGVNFKDMKRIMMLLTLVSLVAISLFFLGIIGANLNFDQISIEVLSFKNLFLGITKIMPLILLTGFIMIIQKELNKNG